jgi:RHS repeat-associated protein
VDYPWGTVRPGPNNALPTGYTYTGQLDSGLGLMYYGARFYDGALGRFISPDTIVPEPGNPQSLNRYSYVGNRPTMLVDPSGHCSTPSVDGSIGCTGVTGGLTVPLIIDPATQPLTVAATGPQDTQRAEMRAHYTAADDGVLLMYQIPGYANGRAEVVIVNAGAPDNPFVNGGVEVRRVWSGNESYEETAVSGGIGPFGAEWSSHKGETVPSIGTNVAGVGVQLQPGQLMTGVVNPMGPGGVRVGAEWRVESAKTFITSREFLQEWGGTGGFGLQFAGSDARLLRQVFVGRRGNMSGIQYLRLLNYAYDFPFEEQP